MGSGSAKVDWGSQAPSKPTAYFLARPQGEARRSREELLPPKESHLKVTVMVEGQEPLVVSNLEISELPQGRETLGNGETVKDLDLQEWERPNSRFEEERGCSPEEAPPTSPDTSAQLESALKDAATTEESFRTHKPRYTTKLEELIAEGLKVPDDVVVRVRHASAGGYCVEAALKGTPNSAMHYDSNRGLPEEGTC